MIGDLFKPMTTRSRKRRPASRGFALVEALVSMTIGAIALTALVAGLASAGELGVAARRKALASALARQLADEISKADYGTDPRLADANPANNGDLADSGGKFGGGTIPVSAGAADWAEGSSRKHAGENFNVYVNVQPVIDGVGTEEGKRIAVIIRYRIGGAFGRAVAMSYRYNPTAVGAGKLPL